MSHLEKNSFSLDSFQELCNAHCAQPAHDTKSLLQKMAARLFYAHGGVTALFLPPGNGCAAVRLRWVLRYRMLLLSICLGRLKSHGRVLVCVCAGVCFAFTVIKPWWSVQLSLSVNCRLLSAFIESRRCRVGELCRWLCEGKRPSHTNVIWTNVSDDGWKSVPPYSESSRVGIFIHTDNMKEGPNNEGTLWLLFLTYFKKRPPT